MKRWLLWGMVGIGSIAMVISAIAFAHLLDLDSLTRLVWGICIGLLYGIFAAQFLYPHSTLRQGTRYQYVLAKIRAWIDRRLPRDVLRVTVINTDTGATLFSSTHMDIILQLKMDQAGMTYPCPGHILVQFTTEYLTP
jgi:hypothetical protein